MRKISFKLLTQTALIDINTEARTFGELKAEVRRNPQLASKIPFGDVQLMERVTKAVFMDIDSAILPEGDIILFVVPKKTKSGSKPDLGSMGYMDLLDLAQDIMSKDPDAWFDTAGTAAELHDQLSDYYDNIDEEEVTPADEVIEEAVTNLQAAKELIEDTIEQLSRINISSWNGNLTETERQLQKEAEELSRLARQ